MEAFDQLEKVTLEINTKARKMDTMGQVEWGDLQARVVACLAEAKDCCLAVTSMVAKIKQEH